ncbi:MAG: glutathione S-transferase family protein [Aestuariivirga sp.]|uniref:glutathione S-transferase family protein n=1 Tax=Aestuariivirga sp. TaxID=2650926 RepID=UPI0025C4EBA7|nr:glutathione S-transferase family protein [Aestuariivirga sp.]MCA3559595.1 glutathione S-transferase family protein [Aestuariivirga sp.]
MPSLIHFTLDPFSRRLRLALAEYGVPVELIDEEPWEPMPEIFELNPAGTLPVYLEDAETALSGIEAITEYLEETKAARLSLIPGDAFERAEVRRLAGWFDVKFYAEVSEPLLTEKVIRRFLGRERGGGGPDTARVRQAMSRLRGHLDYISHLVDHRVWLAGDELSIADLAAAGHISAADYFGDIPWADYPVAKGWYQRVKSRPSFRPLLADTIRGMAPGPHYADLDF